MECTLATNRFGDGFLDTLVVRGITHFLPPGVAEWHTLQRVRISVAALLSRKAWRYSFSGACHVVALGCPSFPPELVVVPGAL